MYPEGCAPLYCVYCNAELMMKGFDSEGYIIDMSECENIICTKCSGIMKNIDKKLSAATEEQIDELMKSQEFIDLLQAVNRFQYEVERHFAQLQQRFA